MNVQAIAKNVRISPLKLRVVARELAGMSAQQAMHLLKWIPRKSARIVAKTLKSAIANAENNYNIPIERLLLKEVLIDKGFVMKRFQPVSRGSAHSIRKRMSHIKIVLTSNDKVFHSSGK